MRTNEEYKNLDAERDALASRLAATAGLTT